MVYIQEKYKFFFIYIVTFYCVVFVTGTSCLPRQRLFSDLIAIFAASTNCSTWFWVSIPLWCIVSLIWHLFISPWRLHKSLAKLMFAEILINIFLAYQYCTSFFFLWQGLKNKGTQSLIFHFPLVFLFRHHVQNYISNIYHICIFSFLL